MSSLILSDFATLVDFLISYVITRYESYHLYRISLLVMMWAIAFGLKL